MEITGILTMVEPYTQISEKFGKAAAVFTMQNGQYQNDLYVEFHNKSADLLDNMEIGQDYTVSINLASREWNGKYFTTVRAWKVVPASETPAPKKAPAPAPVAKPQAPAPLVSDYDDLPF